jgi:hypothetical protein
MIRHFGLALSPLILLFVVGCSPYVEDFYYSPRPAIAQIVAAQAPPATTQPGTFGSMAPQQAPPPVVMTFASVIGIFRGDRSQGIPESVHVRFRLENRGPETAIFQPQTLELIDGSLLKFPPPLMQPPQEITLAPTQSAMADAYFPFPPGRSWQNTDLATLKLSWVTQIAGQGVSQGVDFYRIFPGYYYPRYWGYPGPAVSIGGVFVFRRR